VEYFFILLKYIAIVASENKYKVLFQKVLNYKYLSSGLLLKYVLNTSLHWVRLKPRCQ